LSKFCNKHGHKDLKEITAEEVFAFVNSITEGKKLLTKRIRFSHLTAFFNFTRNNTDEDFQNPFGNPMLKKLFRAKTTFSSDILEKEVVDEIIFKAENPRNRLMLELMARGGMRIGEVLKLTPSDVNEWKSILRDPKSGKEQGFVFIPQ
jgi:integrase/recombinase XerD